MTPTQERILTDLVRATTDDSIKIMGRRADLARLSNIEERDFFAASALSFLLLFISIMEVADPDLTEPELGELIRSQYAKHRIRL